MINMALYFVRRTVTIVAFVALARAQKTSNVIPDDLQTGFTRGTEVQASYTGEAVNGFLDGTSFGRDGKMQPKKPLNRTNNQ